ncbi:hypothetical protein ACEWY4_007731 [Coilia grayii]|uniref:C2H2-type domain-containing protein n=1 Tax=Coilia grayii TaxID=363190 RepID=A0ABD1K9K6_9TELE
MPPQHQCTKCLRRTFTLTKLIKHIGLVHAHEPNFNITCGLKNCQSSFSKYHSFRRHIYRKHTKSLFPSTEDKDHDNDNDAEQTEGDPTSESLETPPSMDQLLTGLKDNLFRFALKCREKNRLAISVQQDVVDDVQFLLCFFKENYDAFISYHLEKNGFNVAQCEELREVMSSTDIVDKACEVIRSPFMMQNHCKSKMDLTEPVNYTLRNASGDKIGNFSYVPITQVLKKYCSVEDVWDQILADSTKASDSEVLRDFTDGDYYKQHLFFRENPQPLRLHLYEDEFEIVNPLGAKRNKYKICAFYYTVGNIGDKYRSKLSHIHLALMVRYIHLKECGLDEILTTL